MSAPVSFPTLRKAAWQAFALPLWRLLDLLLPKRDCWWGFPVHYIKSDQFIENCRAVFEGCREEPGIRPIIFARGGPLPEVEGQDPRDIVRLASLRGLWLLARCRVLFVANSISMDYALRWGPEFAIVKPALGRRLIVNLWHGIPLKGLYTLANRAVRERLERFSYRVKERRHYAGLIASSKIDGYAMALSFQPLPAENVWVTGLPRNDFLLMEEDRLPAYFRRQVQAARGVKGGRRLVTYAPTYRQSAVADAFCYQFTPQEIAELSALLRRRNAVFGFRMHYFRSCRSLFNLERFIDNEVILDLGHARFPEIAPVLRATDLLVTDYSSVSIDALYLNKPIVCFAYDRAHYESSQDGLLYDLELVMPGPIVQDFAGLLRAIDAELGRTDQCEGERYRMARRFFFQHVDCLNTRRVIDRVKAALAS